MLSRVGKVNSGFGVCSTCLIFLTALAFGYGQSPSLRVHQLTTQSGNQSYSRLVDGATGNSVNQGASLQWGRLEAYNNDLNTLISGAATLTVQAAGTRPAIAFSVAEARQPNDFVKMPTGDANGHKGATQSLRSGVVYLPSASTVICNEQLVPRYRIEAFAQDDSATEDAYSAIDFEIQAAPPPTITGYAPFLQLEQAGNTFNLLAVNSYELDASNGLFTIRWGNGADVIGNRPAIFFITLFNSVSAPYTDVAFARVELTVTLPGSSPQTYSRSQTAIWEAADLDSWGGGSGDRLLTLNDDLIFDPNQYLFQEIRLRFKSELILRVGTLTVNEFCGVHFGYDVFTEVLDHEVVVTVVPEPSSLLILVSSLGLWSLRATRRR